MTLRILAVLAEAASARSCLEGALAAASIEPNARIEALHVKVDPEKLVAAPEEIAIQRLREAQEGTAEDKARTIKAVFDDWIAGQSAADAARILWRELVGSEADTVCMEAKNADLLVLARPHDLDAHDAMHAALFSTDRPLLIPPGWSLAETGGLVGHILVAWKFVPQARQAIEGAAPWLRRASKVTVLAIGESPGSDSVYAAQHLLNELGVAATMMPMPNKGDIADQILDVAKDIGACALVMGAYRHNALIEWALGGTTRHLLSRATIPLFLAH